MCFHRGHRWGNDLRWVSDMPRKRARAQEARVTPDDRWSLYFGHGHTEPWFCGAGTTRLFFLSPHTGKIHELGIEYGQLWRVCEPAANVGSGFTGESVARCPTLAGRIFV
jgi:hypothetical protein